MILLRSIVQSVTSVLVLASLPVLACAQSASGSWYNPVQSGHGLAIDQLTPQSALLLWFTYDATGRQMPLYAEATLRDGEFSGPAFAPFGPRFGDWDPAELQFAPWGTLAFRPGSCTQGALRWQSEEFGAGATPMQVLAHAAAGPCATPPATPMAGVSGTWYHPQLQGASVNVQALPDGGAVAYWYTYDQAGQPMPLYLQGRFDGRKLRGDAIAPRGMRFGSFSRADLALTGFGPASIDFHDCDHATLAYDTQWGKGTLPLVRLTRLQGVDCNVPAGLPENFPRHFEGAQHSLSDIPVSAMLTARDEVMLRMDGKVRRGFFHRAGTSFLIRFDDGQEAYALRDFVSESGVRSLHGYLGGFSFRDFTLRDATASVVTDARPGNLALVQALQGTWGAFQDSPAGGAGTDIRVGADLALGYRKDGRLRAEGRITRIDGARGAFDFELRFRPAGENATHRVMGSGRILRRDHGAGLALTELELFGSGPSGAQLYERLPRP